MILINKENFKLADLAKRLKENVPLDLIKKKPLFEINPALVIADPANGASATKNRHSMEFPCVFNTTLKDGESVEIRYCTSRTPDPKTHGNSEKYVPRVLEFEGKAEFITDDLDKAVYFWLHFFNKTSPFRVEGKPYEYELVDDEAKANKLIQDLTLRGKAATHAASLQGETLMIIAKGMGIVGVEGMDKLMVKAQLMQFASDQPAEYLSKAESNVTHVHGLIVDSIDKGIFKLVSEYNSKRWKWNEGVRKGELIVEISSNVPDHNAALVTFISQHVTDILPVLMETAKVLSGHKNLEKEAANIDVLGGLGLKSTTSEVNTEDDDDPDGDEVLTDTKKSQITMKLPTNYHESVAYLHWAIGSKSPVLAKKLENGVNDKTITYENVKETMESWKK